MHLIRTIGAFFYTDDENLEYITTRECYSTDALPDTLLVIDRAKSTLVAHSGLFLLYKTSDNYDFNSLIRLHEEFEAVERTSKRGTVYISSLRISLDPFLMTDTRQQYIEQVTHYFTGFREMFAKTYMDVRTRPLTLDELIDAVF